MCNQIPLRVLLLSFYSLCGPSKSHPGGCQAPAAGYVFVRKAPKKGVQPRGLQFGVHPRGERKAPGKPHGAMGNCAACWLRGRLPGAVPVGVCMQYPWRSQSRYGAQRSVCRAAQRVGRRTRSPSRTFARFGQRRNNTTRNNTVEFEGSLTMSLEESRDVAASYRRRIQSLASCLRMMPAGASVPRTQLPLKTKFKKLLVANRGEIAVRVCEAAASVELPTVAIYTKEDALCKHVRCATESVQLPASEVGPVAPYLDAASIVQVAKQTGCDALHPGYGFLSESVVLASLCRDAGVTFVGPSPEAIALFGDKTSARALAVQEGVPVSKGSGLLESAAACEVPPRLACTTSYCPGGTLEACPHAMHPMPTLCRQAFITEHGLIFPVVIKAHHAPTMQHFLISLTPLRQLMEGVAVACGWCTACQRCLAPCTACLL